MAPPVMLAFAKSLMIFGNASRGSARRSLSKVVVGERGDRDAGVDRDPRPASPAVRH